MESQYRILRKLLLAIRPSACFKLLAIMRTLMILEMLFELKFFPTSIKAALKSFGIQLWKSNEI